MHTFLLVGAGQFMFTAHRDAVRENKRIMGASGVPCLGAGGCALRSLGKEITLTFQRYAILDAKRQ